MIHVLGRLAVKLHFLSIGCVKLFRHSQVDFRLYIMRSAVTMTFVTSGASPDFDHCFQILFCIAFYMRLFIELFQNNSPFHVIDRYCLFLYDNDKWKSNKPRLQLKRQVRPVYMNKSLVVYKSSLPFFCLSSLILVHITYSRLCCHYDTYNYTLWNRRPIRSCPPVPLGCRLPFPAVYRFSSSFLSPLSPMIRWPLTVNPFIPNCFSHTAQAVCPCAIS